jgi:hypothetical protein
MLTPDYLSSARLQQELKDAQATLEELDRQKMRADSAVVKLKDAMQASTMHCT